jgi:predicted nuclease with TOPRIM domain
MYFFFRMQESNIHLRQQLRQKESDYRNLQDDLEGLNRALRRMNESYTKEIGKGSKPCNDRG